MNSSFSPNPVKNSPVFWGAFAGSLLLFALIRLLPSIQILSPQTEFFSLDRGYAARLPENWSNYSTFPDDPQAFGPRVLSRYALAAGVMVFGGQERAGVWISLLGIIATLAGVCKLARTVFPSREFVVAAGLTAAAASALQGNWSADPAVALGMALVVWSVHFFLSALDLNLPHRVFLSSLLMGLAAYIRIELVILWIPMAIYLLVAAATPSPAKEKGLPLVPMALGGLLQLAMVLWPMIDRNLYLTGSPLLPGFDAERVLGVAGTPAAFSFVGRFLEGFRLLMLNEGGLGIFLGLLWPVGLVLINLRFRESSTPFAWVGLIVTTLLILTGISPLLGLQGYQESLRILVPLLIPLGVYPLAFLLFHLVDPKELSEKHILGCWAGLAAAGVLLALMPTLNQMARQSRTSHTVGDAALLEWFEGEPRLRNAALVTDRPGLFLLNGKEQVHGLNGETNWRLLGKEFRNADGSIHAARLNDYLRQKKIQFLHIASVESPLVDQMRAEPNAPDMQSENITPPHRVFRLQWSEPSGKN